MPSADHQGGPPSLGAGRFTAQSLRDYRPVSGEVYAENQDENHVDQRIYDSRHNPYRLAGRRGADILQTGDQ